MRLSVVIPVYNVAHDLRVCLDSVATAARRLFAHDSAVEVEVICVDDGSTDGSAAILDAYATPHPSPLIPHPSSLTYRVIHQPNGGVAAARNRGLELATGDWFAFVDGDDVVRDDWLVNVSDACRSCQGADLVMYGMNPFYTKRVEWPTGDARSRQVVSLSSEIGDLFVGVSVCQLAYRRQLCADMRFPGLAVGEDLVFTARALARARSCVVLPRQEYGYRYRADSATHTGLSMRKLRDTVTFHVEMFRVLEASGKRIGRAFTEGRGRMWLEELPKLLLPIRKTPEGRAVWETWLDSLSVAAELRCLTDVQRARARRVAASRSAWSVRWNCRLPAWLRRKGLLK